jgi:DNA helicase-2/ATP-dependent DNA helicase PcrA
MKLHLSTTQDKIVKYGEGSLLVIAGPGSGKTQVLTERIRRLLTEEKGNFRILALTFTHKAANEMKERLLDLPNIYQRVFIGTLHSFCLEVIANRGKSIGIEHLPDIIESNQERQQILLQAVINDPDLSYQLKKNNAGKQHNKILNNWLERIDQAKKNLQLPEMLNNDIERKVYEVYNNSLRISNSLDFDDLLLLTYQLFTEYPKIAAFYRRIYRYICIDEAQDLNKAQYHVILALCGDDYKNVMMVGDPKQVIFSWNGASPEYMVMFKQAFNAQTIEMKENFRSSQKVVYLANKLNNKYQIEAQLPIMGDVKLIIAEDEAQEANLVINYIKKLIENGHPSITGSINWNNCALIARNKYALLFVEKELDLQGYRYYKQTSLQEQSESELLRDFELCLRILANPRGFHLSKLLSLWQINGNLTSFTGFSNSWEVFKLLDKCVTLQQQKVVLEAIDLLKYRENKFKLINSLQYLKAYAESIDSSEERAIMELDISGWQTYWNEFLPSPSGKNLTAVSFLSYVALGNNKNVKHDGIALLTVHAAKGLEFDVVMILGMSEGTFPDYRARSAQDLQEERRNMFVAVTRSRRIIGFSYPKSKIMPWGEVKLQKPSRYLEIMEIMP